MTIKDIDPTIYGKFRRFAGFHGHSATSLVKDYMQKCAVELDVMDKKLGKTAEKK